MQFDRHYLIRLLRICPLRVRMPLFHRLRKRLLRDLPNWEGDLFAAAELALAPGFKMKLSPCCVIHQSIAVTGCYELDLSRRIVELARNHPGGMMVDVGANYGYFSILWAAQHPTNRVMAFEAAPRNHGPLTRNMAINAFTDRVRVLVQAAGRCAGVLPFVEGPEEQTGWGGLAATNDRTTVLVPVVRLDETLPNDLHVHVLKIDTEGADTWVIQGAERLLAQKRIGVIFFEENRGRMLALGIAEGEASRFLEQHGYACRPLTKSGLGLVEFVATPR